MEVKKHRPVGLTGLFWRYLLAVGAGCIGIALLWWMGMVLMLNLGFVRPAYTGARQIDATVQTLSAAETFDPQDIPYFYRWEVFKPDGTAVHAGNLDAAGQADVRALLQGQEVPRRWFYDAHYALTPLADGTVCALQYDYSMPYADPALHAVLPDFQACAVALLVLLWFGWAAACTHRSVRILRRDAVCLTAATDTIAARRLDKPLAVSVQVRELHTSLEAMERLRQMLAQSLEQQWAMEQERRQQIAALTHDLKTPLTIIRGNAELLAEDGLDSSPSVQAILRSAGHLTEYLAALRALSDADRTADEDWQTVSLSELMDDWAQAGRGLCAPRRITFQAGPPPALICRVQRQALGRAVWNLLDNAVRYTPADGTVTLDTVAGDGLLHIVVGDTGPGFSPAALAHAGQVFYTSDASRPQDGHAGIGLYYAGQVAARHGGRLTAENAPVGACVRLTLTLHPEGSA